MSKSSSNRPTTSQAPDENEIHEYMHSSTPQTNHNYTNQSELTTNGDISIDQPQESLGLYNTSPTSPTKNHLISQLKHRLIPHRQEQMEREEHDQEKNRGFLLINQVDSDLILVPTENSDPEHTRHAETSEHTIIDDDILNIDHIQLESTTPITPHLSPPSSILSVRNHSNSEFDIQATQAGVECATPDPDTSNVLEAQLSGTNSSSSTSSSNNDVHVNHLDRVIFNDIDYVLEQKRDLERITVFEIALNDERRDYQQDLPQNEHDELDFNLRYNDALEQNQRLKEELECLRDENFRVYAPWSCEVCTYNNEPYFKTRSDVCEMCEGPSPLKKHTLIS